MDFSSESKKGAHYKLERRREKLPGKMSDLGGNPHLEGIISDFEGLEHLFLFPGCVYGGR